MTTPQKQKIDDMLLQSIDTPSDADVSPFPTAIDEALLQASGLEGSITLQTSDGKLIEIEKRIAFLSPVLQQSYDPVATDSPIGLHEVSSDAMAKVIEYCAFHLAPGHSIKERKNFNKQFMRMDTARLCELASASHYLDLKSLIDLTCRGLAKHIQGKNPEEIRETFNLPDDLTAEEKLAPIDFATDDSRVRLLNQLYAKKRKELVEAKRLPDGPRSVGGPKEDTRSVDDLLSFIEGSDSTDSAASGGKKASSKSAKKKRDRQKKKERERAAHGVNMQAEQEAPQAETTKHVEAALGGSKPTARGAANAGSARREVAPTSADLRSMLDSFEFGDSDEDDDLDLDPEQRAKQDREVEEFRRRLNGLSGGSSWLAAANDGPGDVASNSDVVAYSIAGGHPMQGTESDVDAAFRDRGISSSSAGAKQLMNDHLTVAADVPAASAAVRYRGYSNEVSAESCSHTAADVSSAAASQVDVAKSTPLANVAQSQTFGARSADLTGLTQKNDEIAFAGVGLSELQAVTRAIRKDRDSIDTAIAELQRRRLQLNERLAYVEKAIDDIVLASEQDHPPGPGID